MSYFNPIYRDLKLVGETGDLWIENGDFVLEKSDQVHIDHILISSKGQWRENPVIGVGLIQFLNSEISTTDFKKKVRLQLEFDNMKVDAVNVGGNQVNIQAKRIK